MWSGARAPTIASWWAPGRARRKPVARRAAPGPRLRAATSSAPDDVRAMALPVLEHRLLLRPESELEGVRTGEVLDRILHEVPVPR